MHRTCIEDNSGYQNHPRNSQSPCASAFSAVGLNASIATFERPWCYEPMRLICTPGQYCNPQESLQKRGNDEIVIAHPERSIALTAPSLRLVSSLRSLPLGRALSVVPPSILRVSQS